VKSFNQGKILLIDDILELLKKEITLQEYNRYIKQLATFIIQTKRGIPFIRKER